MFHSFFVYKFISLPIYFGFDRSKIGISYTKLVIKKNKTVTIYSNVMIKTKRESSYWYLFNGMKLIHQWHICLPLWINGLTDENVSKNIVFQTYVVTT